MTHRSIVCLRIVLLAIGLVVLFQLSFVNAQDTAELENHNAAESSTQTQLVDERLLSIDDTTVDTESTEVSRGVGVGDVLRLLLVLIVVVALIYGTFLLLRRATRSHYKTSELLELISSLPLGGSRAIHVVKIATKFFIVGCAEQGVELISEITDKDTIDVINSQAPQQQSAKGFGEQLGSLLSIFGKKSSSKSSASSATTSPFVGINRQSSRLSNLTVKGNIDNIFPQDN